MNRLIALGVSIGVLAGIFTWIGEFVDQVGSVEAPFVAWVGFAAWACFYGAGGQATGLLKTLGANISGLAWGVLIVWAAVQLGSGSAVALALCVAVGAFGMCAQAFWAPLSFIPGAFVGAAFYFGNGTLVLSTLISLVAGALLAYVSEVVGDLMTRTVEPASQRT